ncbi:MAG TPA: response regulator transcription factor [Xanthobacteraceae bacterium]|nr:response regulator transcription factor [Xanthobacteraceae bacterium]
MLDPVGFRIVTSKPDMADVSFDELPKDEATLLVIEAGDEPHSVISHIVRFKQNQPLGRVVLVQNHWCTADIATAFEAGANACFTAIMDSNELLKAIELIMLGHQTLLPTELVLLLAGTTHKVPLIDASNVADNSQIGLSMRPHFHLSPREASILSGLARGASNKLIAREINISEATVKVHVKAILRKIGVANRTQAAVWAMTNGHSATTSALDPESADLIAPQFQH